MGVLWFATIIWVIGGRVNIARAWLGLGAEALPTTSFFASFF